MSFYYKAYSTIIDGMWGGGFFDKQKEESCYQLGLDAFSRDGVYSKELRKLLQLQFMIGLYSYDEETDLLKREEDKIRTDNNLIRRILLNTCMIYNDEVNRQFKTDSKQSEKLENIQFNEFMQRCHILGKFNGKILAFVYWNSQTKKIELKTITPAYFKWRQVGEDWELWISNIIEKIRPFEINSASDIGTNWDYEYFVWTKQEMRTVDKLGRNIKPSIPNIVGEIPFVEIDFSNFNRFDFYDNDSGMYELLESQLITNSLNFAVYAGASYSNISFLHLQNIEIKDVSKFGLGGVITTKRNEDDAETSIEFITAPASFNEADTYNTNFVKDTYKNHAIPSGIVEGGGIMSGEAMKMDRVELDEIRRSDIKIMEFYEKQITKMIDLVSAKYRNAYNLGDYTILFNDMEIITDPTVRYELKKEQFANDYISIYDFMREIGYVGSDEEIKDILIKIKEVNSEFRPEVAGQRSPSSEAIEGDEGIDNELNTEDRQITE
jgi:hypothetical protein